MLHLITNSAARLQLRSLCSWKWNSGSVLYIITAQKSSSFVMPRKNEYRASVMLELKFSEM